MRTAASGRVLPFSHLVTLAGVTACLGEESLKAAPLRCYAFERCRTDAKRHRVQGDFNPQ